VAVVRGNIALFWIDRTGVAWLDLHEHFAKWLTAYRQFRHNVLNGLWELLREAFNDGSGGNSSFKMIDRTILRAHHCSAGAKEGIRVRSLGRSKGGFKTKTHLRINALGLLRAFAQTESEAPDYKCYLPIINGDGPVPKVLIADKEI
jgi:transposase